MHPFLVAGLVLPVTLAQFGAPPQGENIPPKVDPTKFENFTWADPFASPKISLFDAACSNTRTFAASEYQLHDLSDSSRTKGLAAYGAGLRTLFGGRPYPGGWDGMDAHGYERELLAMEWQAVPKTVREWIVAQEKEGGAGKGLFGVFEKLEDDKESAAQVEDLSAADGESTVIFSPGAIYDTLPLWVAEGSDCKATLNDLSKYSPKLVDGGVVGWVTEHTKPARSNGQRAMKFEVKAQVLSGQADASVKAGAKDSIKSEGKDEL